MEDRTFEVVIADARPTVRFGLRVLLEEQPGWRVVAEAADVKSLLERLRTTCPDVVLVDCDLPDTQPQETLASLRRACPGIRVILMSIRDDLRPVALQSGADLFVYKADPPDRLLQLIRGLTATHVAP